MSDTSSKGAYTKDAVYLKGFFDVLNFAKKHDIDELYIGKVGISDLPLLKKSEFAITKPKYTLKSLLEQGMISPSERRVDEKKVFDLL